MAGSKVQGGAIEFHLLYLCIKALWWRLCVHQCSLSSSMRQESSSHGGGGGGGGLEVERPGYHLVRRATFSLLLTLY